MSNFSKESKEECKGRTIHCRHEGTCINNTLKGMMRSFGLALGIQVAVSALFTALSLMKKKGKGNLPSLKEILSLPLFFCS